MKAEPIWLIPRKLSANLKLLIEVLLQVYWYWLIKS